MATKYLLLEDVEGLGRKGELVNAKAGYARNYLVPKGFALMADPRTLRMQARLQAEREARAAEDRREAEAQAEQIAEMQLEVVVKLDPEGNMYGSVTLHDIHNLLEKKGILVERRAILLKHPIKTVGSHKIALRLKEGVPAAIQLDVSGEGQPFIKEAKAQETAAEE